MREVHFGLAKSGKHKRCKRRERKLAHERITLVYYWHLLKLDSCASGKVGGCRRLWLELSKFI